MTLPTVELSLWRADAVVLFDWLVSVDEEAIPISHPAQKQALRDLLVRLETQTDVPGTTDDEIAAAQEAVARDM